MISQLVRCAATVETDTVAFHGDELPDGVELGDLVLPDRTVATVRLPLPEAVPVLTRARRDPRGHPTAAFWGAVVVVALRRIAQGTLGPEDVDRLTELATRMPVDADNTGAPAEKAVRAFVEAIAGPIPRHGLHVVGLRLSLRVEPDGTCVPQAHDSIDSSVVLDAGDLWERGDDHSRASLRTALRRAARRWPPLYRLLDQEIPDRLGLSEDEVADLIANATRLGVDVHWPRDLLGSLDSQVVLGRIESRGLLSAESELMLDGVALTKAEVDVLAEAHRTVVRLRNRWVVVDRALMPRVLQPLTVAEALGAALDGHTTVDGAEVRVVPQGRLAALHADIADPAGAERIPQPVGLTATLREYQVRGLRWLARMTELGLGACLADDMGLGKTITVIALHLLRGGTTLVVCPASLLGNWAREIERFAPGVRVGRYHGRERSLPDSGFLLTTYGTMRRDAARLAVGAWDLVVADEAQHVKNAGSATAKALRTIPSRARVALTGTPVENALTDLWAVLDWTTPGLLGTADAFRARWILPIEKDPKLADRLARVIRPFVLRRKKSDPGIAPELPAKTETDHAVALTREQAGLYTAVVRESLSQIQASSGMARRGHVLRLLTSLKQVCNHPAQYLGERNTRLAGRSGKLALLDELLGTILAEGGAALVFTQYVAMGRLLERHLRERGIATGFLHGGTSVSGRDELVRRFGDGEFSVFLLSLRAAGVGLNLVRADHVVHYDRWWNPAVEDQATDRAYRIGQTRAVQVHRVIAEGTVEERVGELLKVKRGMADAVLGGGRLSELSDDELAALVELRR
ncbi:DEAD/DEAH box helicase [Actinokineospora enzanensis]|uniref:DEAD/DEAH box helicase n=1 Tax=Actinokineospora enzanensis TaxID=155975 RepID=UPI00035C6603|nr:DEAD/DEAH box helicase [Actinokineospora enzanensis]